MSDTCPIVGKSIREGEFRTRYDAVVIAVHRNGERIQQKIGDIVLKPGDTLLLETHRAVPAATGATAAISSSSRTSPTRAPRRHDKAWIAVAILAAMVAVMALRRLHWASACFNAALLAAAAMGLTRCVSAEQARRSIDWPTLVAIGAALGIGQADGDDRPGGVCRPGAWSSRCSRIRPGRACSPASTC